MALIEEDGSCVPMANALVTRAEFLAYVADYRPDLTIADDVTTDAAIMRASRWISVYPEWEGEQTCGRGLQGLALPRTGMVDCNGDNVPDDEVPDEVKQATFLAAIAELASPGILSPTITPGQQTKRVKVDVIEEEYMTPKDQGFFDGTTDPSVALRPVLTAVQDLLRCLATMPGGAQVPWPFVA